MDDAAKVNDEDVGATDIDSRVSNFIQRKYDHKICEWKQFTLF